MDFRSFIVSITLALIGLTSCIMNASANTVSKQSEIAAIMQRTRVLEQEISALRHQLKQLQAQSRQDKTNPVPLAVNTQSKPMPIGLAMIEQAQANPVLASAPNNIRGKLIDSSSPLKLLQERQKAGKAWQKLTAAERYPEVEIGGNIMGSVSANRSYHNTNSSSVNLSGTTVSIALAADSWVTGLIKLLYDSGRSPDYNSMSYGIGNSRILLSNATVTAGNLTKSPFYISAGQMPVPFANVSAALPNLTSRLGKSIQRALLAGFQQPGTATGFNAAIYSFRGDSRIYPEKRMNNGGANIGYIFANKALKIESGASVIANIADSAGMQNTRAPFILFDNWIDEEELADDFDDVPEPIAGSFAGFGKTAASEILVHRVPGIDIYSKITLKDFSILGEYTGAIRAFDMDNLQFNEHGARPQAYSFETTYKVKLWHYQTTLAAGYSHSYQALPLNMPEQSLSFGIRAALTKYLSGGLIYRHDKNYGIGNFAYGQGLPVLADSVLGRSSNSLTAQLGFKF